MRELGNAYHNSEITEEPLDEVLYDKKQSCPVCKVKFSTKKPRHSKLKLIQEEGDFHKIYRSVNPSYYLASVCPKCGYAYTDQFSKPKPSQIEALKKQVTDKWVERDLGSVRDGNEALESLKLALLCGLIQGEKQNIIATLQLHIAWVYRELQDEGNEQRFLSMAKDSFLKVYEDDTRGEVNLPKLLYLLGELNRRLGNREQAVSWFSKLVSDKRITDQAMINRARAQWQLTKSSK